MRIVRLAAVVLLVLLGCATLVVWIAGRGTFGRFDSELNTPAAGARPGSFTVETARRQQEGRQRIGAPADSKQILFGDLHVHTTISFDAFMLNLPVLGGEGAHPPADACDFARHCAGLDFWSINDHAANIHPEDWQNTIDGIRQCNDLAGDPADPDMVSFLGWEWTQAGQTPETHYGHKNVVLAHTDDARIPSRPIAASQGGTASLPPSVFARGFLALQGGRFHDLARRWTMIGGLPVCDPERDVRDLPDDCREIAPTPTELFRKLDEWGHDAIVIPHGTAWGIYTPPTSSWDKQLEGAMHDPDRQALIEVYSGHGESEVYRDWRAFDLAPDGTRRCPRARPDYLPMCRRAAQLVEERCLAEGESAAECADRAELAAQHAMDGNVSPHVTVVGTSGKDWLDAGQCRDCEQPAFKHRPASSAQYIAALSGFDGGDEPRRFRMGFIASSDIHTGRGGTGYKELRAMTDTGNKSVPRGGGIVEAFLRGEPEEPEARTRTYAEAAERLSGLQFYESERTQSFLYTGGLVAVHSTGRDRGAVFAALERKEVYGTSGPRILLWFDLLTEEGRVPMGSETTATDAPAFRVRAVGSFEQRPGCPEEVTQALGADRTARLCVGECYSPSDARRQITRLEVVRIRPQSRPDESIDDLIEDPWLTYECPDDPAGCTMTFADPDYPAVRRDTVYYVRAYEQEIATVNGDPLRCTRDGEGRCIESRPCTSGDECLAPYEPRAWSSPIYVDYRARGGGRR
jgi:hypothetical protein